jgi:zinc/manganese transport system substrate-binding protein
MLKNFKLISILFVASALAPGLAQAQLSVLTTTTDLGYIVKQVGGDQVKVVSIAKGTQDPHYIEAKPSYMLKASRADLIVAVGLDLEIGYLPPIIRGARNPKIHPGAQGYLEVGPSIDPIEIPAGKISRAEGDVHPYGNPHFTLDPIRDGKAALVIADRLGQLDPSNADKYQSQAKAFQKRMEDKTKEWAARIKKSGVKKIVTYHKTLDYFFDRFNLQNPMQIEPKPGVPPTTAHTLELINTIRQQHIPVVLIENFYDSSIAKRLKQEVAGLRVVTVPVAVDGASGVDSTEALMDKLVSAIEGK